jgi:hypothetical protein
MKFQHQLRKDPLGWCVILVLVLTIVFAVTRHARSHSWYAPLAVPTMTVNRSSQSPT